ncbi:MAG TPA: sensor histidine kinase [Actinomycetota bacterium]|nr:sensor histidine kinase [Actinomycetota bacterium]
MGLSSGAAATVGDGVGGAPAEPLLTRALLAMRLPPFVPGVIASTPSLRVPWLLATAAVSVFAAWGAAANDQVLAFLVVAPVVPVAGVAAAYGPWADPMFETTRSTPVSGFHVVLARTIAAGATCLPLMAASVLVVPGSEAAALAWVMPALALSLASLVVSTFTSLPRAALAAAAAWCLLVGVVAATDEVGMLFDGPGQVTFLAIAVVASFLLARRRERFEIEGLKTRRALVDAADAERRRIERNIHDGAQQQLVAIGVKAGIARTFVSQDPDRAIAIIDELRDDAQEALDALRDMTRGGSPPVLADEGLEAALKMQAKRASVPVTIDARDVGRLPTPVEVAAYFCCLEAMQNAAKHARSPAIIVTVRRSVGEIAISVCDSGVGFDPATVRRGIGTRSMAERVEALGGSLEVSSMPGRGTLVAARLPLTRS